MTTPQPNASPPPAMNEDEVLDYTHQKRVEIVNALTEKGVPKDDPKVLGALLQTLDGMDRSALGKKRIKVEEKANATQEQASGIIAQLLQKVTSANPYEVQNAPARIAPTLPAAVPPPSLVEGETATVAPQQNYDSFVAQGAPSGGRLDEA